MLNLKGFLDILDYCLTIILLFIIVRAFLVSFIDEFNPIMKILNIIAIPILFPFKKLQNCFFDRLAIDISPVLLFVTVSVLRKILLLGGNIFG